MINEGLIGTFAIGVQALWPDPPVTLDSFFDRPAWERPTVDNPFVAPTPAPWPFDGTPGFTGDSGYTGNADGLGGGFDGGLSVPAMEWVVGDITDPLDGGTVTVTGVPTITITAERLRFYRLEVYDVDGDKLSSVPGWISGSLKMQLDRASELSFTVPLGAEGLDELVRPNSVWLRDRWGFVVDTFQIMKRRPRGAGDSSYFDFECIGAISQLGEEIVVEYDSSATALTVAEHVESLMLLQGRDDALEIGDIEPTRSMKFYAADTTIHAALLQLQLALPKAERGRMYVDPQRRLQWLTLVGDQTEQVITRAANVQSLQAETDYGQIVNRLYFYGEGNDPRDRLSLIDAGESVEYVEDTTSQTTWGLRPMLKQDKRFKIPENLLLTANRIIEEFKDPITTVEVDLLDLAKSDDAPAGWADLYIGGKYRVVDTDLDVDSSVEIVALEVDLARPVPVRVELTNQVYSLADLLTRLFEATQQPLDVDGDRYPTMGRNYSSRDAQTERAGDVRWNSGADRAEMHDGTDWQPMGGLGWTPIEAADYAELVADYPANTQEIYALAVITSGTEKYGWYEIGDDGGSPAWRARTFWKAP